MTGKRLMAGLAAADEARMRQRKMEKIQHETRCGREPPFPGEGRCRRIAGIIR
jgi:hypothetical protein